MPNSFFRFRQFTVHQEHCAMKVCTDACLFGAWLAPQVYENSILDIGTGTGLLSLMLAQRCSATIDAIEIDEAACRQASENFAASPWAVRLNIFNGAVQDFTGKRYELVVANPPFYETDLKSAHFKKNLALHSEALTLEELTVHGVRLLERPGRLAVILPAHRAAAFKAMMSETMYLQASCLVKQTPQHAIFRTYFIFSTQKVSQPSEETIIIRNDEKEYTSRFAELLHDYYL